MDPFITYLKEDRLPEDPAKAKKMPREASKYVLLSQRLYRRDVRDSLKRIRHPWSICTRSYPLGHFTNWGGGVDILGPFPIAHDQLKFLIVAVDYFTKWVEEEPIATISSKRIKCFFWKKIICRFSMPAKIVSDNGMQFASRTTAEFFKGLRIKQLFTSVEHPQANGQAETANKVILRGLWKRLEEAKGRWVEELPRVLWSYHTTPHSTTNETPFRLTGDDSSRDWRAVPQTTLFELNENEEELKVNLDMLQGVREIAYVREYVVKARAARKYDKRIVLHNFKPQDLMLRKVTQKAESNKLTPIWEGLFRILKEVGRGAYRLPGWQEGTAHVECHHLMNVLQLSNRMLIQKQRYLQTRVRTIEEADPGYYNELQTHEWTTEEADPRYYDKLQTCEQMAEEVDPGYDELQTWERTTEDVDLGYYYELQTRERTVEEADSRYYDELQTHKRTTEEADLGYYDELQTPI
ncbi:Tf2-8, partial [Mucuna pruriens]